MHDCENNFATDDIDNCKTITLCKNTELRLGSNLSLEKLRIAMYTSSEKRHKHTREKVGEDRLRTFASIQKFIFKVDNNHKFLQVMSPYYSPEAETLLHFLGILHSFFCPSLLSFSSGIFKQKYQNASDSYES